MNFFTKAKQNTKLLNVNFHDYMLESLPNFNAEHSLEINTSTIYTGAKWIHEQNCAPNYLYIKTKLSHNSLNKNDFLQDFFSKNNQCQESFTLNIPVNIDIISHINLSLISIGQALEKDNDDDFQLQSLSNTYQLFSESFNKISSKALRKNQVFFTKHFALFDKNYDLDKIIFQPNYTIRNEKPPVFFIPFAGVLEHNGSHFTDKQHAEQSYLHFSKIDLETTNAQLATNSTLLNNTNGAISMPSGGFFNSQQFKLLNNSNEQYLLNLSQTIERNCIKAYLKFSENEFAKYNSIKIYVTKQSDIINIILKKIN